MVGLALLEELLKQTTVDRVTRYVWRPNDDVPMRSYLKVYVVGKVHAAWDGPETDEAWALINAAPKRDR